MWNLQSDFPEPGQPFAASAHPDNSPVPPVKSPFDDSLFSFNRLTGKLASNQTCRVRVLSDQRDSMSTQPFEPKVAPPANLVQIGASIEDVIQQRLAEERARLGGGAGLHKSDVHHF